MKFDNDAPIIGPGLDFNSWNGAVLAISDGAMFGVRVGFMKRGFT